MRNKELIIIAGPTGVGKTQISLEIAQQLGTEIISADSRQIYKEMSVGTAVPAPEQLEAVKHHFIQTKSIHDYYNASMYEQEVLQDLKNLFKKYDKVILCGGTGLYIDAVRKGIDELPEVDMELRKQLQYRMEEEGLESLRHELRLLDPESYSRIDLKNPKRVQKALEVCFTTGKPYSAFLNRPEKKRDFKQKLIVLNIDREKLYKQINQRTDQMIASGWVEEAKKLYPYRHTNALKTLGYKELFAYLEGTCTIDQAVEIIKANTRKYARKQITWFRKDPGYKWFSTSQFDEIMKAIENE